MEFNQQHENDNPCTYYSNGVLGRIKGNISKERTYYMTSAFRNILWQEMFVDLKKVGDFKYLQMGWCLL